MMYATKIVTSTAASTSVSVDFNGKVSPYSVASTRNAISTECDRSRHTSVVERSTFGPEVAAPCRAAPRGTRYAAMNTTIDQPTPISSWFPPVMFASASGA